MNQNNCYKNNSCLLLKQLRQERTHRHIVSQIQKADEVEKQQLARDIAKQNAKINRIEHFRALEDRAQAMKGLNYQVNEQNNHIMRSQILP